ncbi:hypothetical protein [Streptomyces flavofungini]|uniref:hypothetical protein n=1 Tax=Streptomyces flavofungini TaxID=68200 RepID=UPI0025B27563|nr:hypothetical protein [Streptomyces flavofungini]WJV47521.1 hypothetical protein QUY26_19505 [Streptomyces flavofungini]
MISIDYRQFYVIEEPDSDFDVPRADRDFASGNPVLVTPGEITICSEVQWHYAPVTLCRASADVGLPPLADQWALLDSVEYRPVYHGGMRVLGCTTGPATPEVRLELSPGRTYTVHVYAKGREDAHARWEEYLADDVSEDDKEAEDDDSEDGEFDDFHEQVFEEYLIVFVPLGYQEAPQPADRPR